VPQFPQARLSVAPTAQTPSPEQDDQEPQVQEEEQVRLWVPQFPQAWD
jgi:hypothetical protein